MTTSIAFTPQPNASPPFQASVTLDGAAYNLTCTWNLVGRWYFTISDQGDNAVYAGALVGSPPDYDIPLAPGIFQASTLLYRADTGSFEINP